MDETRDDNIVVPLHEALEAAIEEKQSIQERLDELEQKVQAVEKKIDK